VPVVEPLLEPPDVEVLDTPFKRRVALALAVLAFVGGVFGLAASLAGGREDQLTRDAQQSAVMALGEQSVAHARYFDVVGSHTEVRLLQQRVEMAHFRAMLLPGTDDGALAGGWHEAERALSDLSRELAGTPYADQAPRLAQDLFLRPRTDQLRADAMFEAAASWGDDADRYVLGITLLAISLSLLGLSLTVTVRVRRPLVQAAALISFFAVGLGVVTAVTPVVGTPREAVEAVAEGDRLSGLRRYDEAVEAYSRALGLRPDYAVALRQRASARILAESPEGLSALYVYTISSPEARRAAVEDLARAINPDAPDYMTLVNQGGNLFHLREYERSEAYTRQAIVLNDELPLPWSNLGLALAAQGDARGARSAYDQLVERVLRRPDPQERAEIFAASRTTLEMLATMEPDRAELALEFQGLLVAAQSESPPGLPAETAEVSGLRLQASGAQLVAAYSHRGIPEDGVVSWVGYVRHDDDMPWQQRPDLVLMGRFGLATPGEATVNLIDSLCPPAGTEYRVDFWLGDQRLATARTTTTSLSDTTSLVGSVDVAGRFSTCRPSDWDITREVPAMLAVQSSAGDASVVVRAAPVPAELSSTPEVAARAAVDAQAAQFAERSTVAPIQEGQVWVGGLLGTARRYPAASDGGLIWVWAGVGADGMVRVVGVKYAASEEAVVSDLVALVRFFPRP
jgi:tetratricopeptide (TPR) repeat protein